MEILFACIIDHRLVLPIPETLFLSIIPQQCVSANGFARGGGGGAMMGVQGGGCGEVGSVREGGKSVPELRNSGGEKSGFEYFLCHSSD